jgi:hypothetical protein
MGNLPMLTDTRLFPVIVGLGRVLNKCFTDLLADPSASEYIDLQQMDLLPVST